MSLSALLSQVLVAFIIDCDNEFEHLTPHTTSIHGSTGAGPWLASMAMWWTCMRFVGEEGIHASELENLARTQTNLNGMARWGYITFDPDTKLIRATRKGLRAREVWRALPGAIEERWQSRFGKNQIDQLRKSLQAVLRQIPYELPDCLPILGYGLYTKDRAQVRPVASSQLDIPTQLPALLSRVLLAFGLEFERESEVSLAISANVLRVLNDEGVRVRDLPSLSGVSKEAISMAMGFLKKRKLVIAGPDPAASRTKIARLTAQGLEAQDDYRKLIAAIEKRWETRFGKDNIHALREVLANLASQPTADPYPDGWRASVRKPDTLPHFPMVLHRGGYPDGS